MRRSRPPSTPCTLKLQGPHHRLPRYQVCSLLPCLLAYIMPECLHVACKLVACRSFAHTHIHPRRALPLSIASIPLLSPARSTPSSLPALGLLPALGPSAGTTATALSSLLHLSSLHTAPSSDRLCHYALALYCCMHPIVSELLFPQYWPDMYTQLPTMDPMRQVLIIHALHSDTLGGVDEASN